MVKDKIGNYIIWYKIYKNHLKYKVKEFSAIKKKTRQETKTFFLTNSNQTK